MKYLFITLALAAILASCTSSKPTAVNTKKAEKAAAFNPASLYGTPWKLVKLESSQKNIDVPADVEATIVFDQKESRVHGRCCNSYFGIFTISGNVVTFDKMGSTKMFCPGIIGEIESLYHSMLAAPQTVSFDGSKMIFKSSNGKLTFTAFNLE